MVLDVNCGLEVEEKYTDLLACFLYCETFPKLHSERRSETLVEWVVTTEKTLYELKIFLVHHSIFSKAIVERTTFRTDNTRFFSAPSKKCLFHSTFLFKFPLNFYHDLEC